VTVCEIEQIKVTGYANVELTFSCTTLGLTGSIVKFYCDDIWLQPSLAKRAKWVFERGRNAMPGEITFRRPTFREGTRIWMADGQQWSFPSPPEPGVDAQYDALAEARRDAEDHDEVLRIELAISMLLLARNYDLSPVEYTRVFDFGDDRDRLRSVQSAISELIASGSAKAVIRHPEQAKTLAREPGRIGRLTSLVSSWAVRVKALLWS
jgi:hypothetical protein